MAKFTKWADRIGETKEVQGVTFTIVGNDGDTVIVEAGDDLHFMSRATQKASKLNGFQAKHFSFNVDGDSIAIIVFWQFDGYVCGLFSKDLSDSNSEA